MASERSTGQAKTKGEASRRLEKRIMEDATPYRKLTVRQFFYILVSRHGYPSTRRFYKLLDYHLVKLRRVYLHLHYKFVDTTRKFLTYPRPFNKLELWVEKDSIRNFVEDLTMKYRVPIQVERGFGSLSMYRDALTRIRERGVEKILYMGDFDPSGLLIESVTGRELGVDVERVALTQQQIRRFNPPSRPVNMRDSRAEAYIAEYGEMCWELEALEPKILTEIVEEKLQEAVPHQFVAQAEMRDQASRIATLLVEKLVERIEEDACLLMEEGIPREELISRLALKYRLPAKAREYSN